jgi:cell division protease FtsH
VIDIEVRRVIDTAYTRARDILVMHRDKLDAMAQALVKYETIDDEQIRDIMAGRDPKPPEGWDDAGGAGGKPASDEAGLRPKGPLGTTPAGQH